MTQEPLVGISEASRILGVSESTLRQWTDEAKIKAFITPGGHRRYLRAELKRFIGSHQRLLGIPDLVTNLEDSAPVHRDIAKGFLQWFSKVSGESQEHLALVSRRFLNLIIKYVTEPAKREETMRLAHESGYDFGETLAKLGLPLTDSVQAFITHRELIMNVVTDLMRKRGTSERVAEAIPLVNNILDQALISLVHAHENYRSASKGQTERGLVDIDNTLAL